MVAITTLTGGAATRVHASGSAVRESVPAEQGGARRETPATIVELSDHARQLVSEAKAMQAALEIFAIANGMPESAESGEGAKGSAADEQQIVIAHDLKANEGLYLVVEA
jgi:hypothetical protein